MHNPRANKEIELETLRTSVRNSFPELQKITDEELRNKVVEAWAIALSETEFPNIEAIPASGRLNGLPLTDGTQADHMRGVALISLGIADALEKLLGNFGIDRDILIAGALCHDIGKPFEFSTRNQDRWSKNPAAAGWPALRHPVYGAHICLSVGLPESVCHVAAAHSQEGDNVVRSLENTIVHYADHAFWDVLYRAELLDGYYLSDDPRNDPRGPAVLYVDSKTPTKLRELTHKQK